MAVGQFWFKKFPSEAFSYLIILGSKSRSKLTAKRLFTDSILRAKEKGVCFWTVMFWGLKKTV